MSRLMPPGRMVDVHDVEVAMLDLQMALLSVGRALGVQMCPCPSCQRPWR